MYETELGMVGKSGAINLENFRCGIYTCFTALLLNFSRESL